MAKATVTHKSPNMSEDDILADYRLAFLSRQASLLGRKEVLTGKAKFGIFGDGKEVAQIAMARAFRPGDWRSGYYRDQTVMLALGVCTLKQFFAQLYADTDPYREPMSGGRQMNAHFASRFIGPDGEWLNQLSGANSSADLSPTAAQMARLVGLGYASKLYRQNPELHTRNLEKFSARGNEVAFGTIGNASAAEGLFWESLNACGVLQVPVAISVWDDGYGISVPNKYQMTKESVSQVCRGFQRDEHGAGFDIHVVEGWDYPALMQAYREGIAKVRAEHVPALFHIINLTQPQGHSTSGSHERYKNAERLRFEQEFDCLSKMREWILSKEGGRVSLATLEKIEGEATRLVEEQRAAAWQEYVAPIANDRDRLMAIYDQIAESSSKADEVKEAKRLLQRLPALLRRSIMASARRMAMDLRREDASLVAPLKEFVRNYHQENTARYSRYLFKEGASSPLQVAEVKAVYADKPHQVPGNEIIQQCFHELMARDPRVFIIGEDVGVLGDVNQNFKGIQDTYGDLRITDTGIREATILGQGIGAAMRGLRPVVDIQYLDYLLYCFQLLSDDVATLHYRSAGGQCAPVIVRTKGHRLEGVWHSGSPMGVIIAGVRGMHVCVPRNMVQAAGLYNTLFQGDDPALVVEVLSGYRLKEAVPENLSEFTVPLGVPEVLISGKHVSIVTYGACVRLAEEAATRLAAEHIAVELIDIQTLLPFDTRHIIRESLQKTNAVLFLDEDVPGGASAFMMQQVLEMQEAYDFLDCAPKTLSAQPNRAAYASDADYWCKPSVEDIIETIYAMMHERDPYGFPL